MDTPRTKALARKWSLKEGCTNGTTSPESAELYDLAFDLEAKLSQAEARVAAMEKDAERYEKLRRWMSSNVPEGWQEVTQLAAIACYVSWDEFDARLDALPECNVGLCSVNPPNAAIAALAE